MNTLERERPAGVAARWRWAVWALLGLLVVAHGCHGDRDTELFARRVSVAMQKPEGRTLSTGYSGPARRFLGP